MPNPKQVIAYCGLVCNECPAYKATKTKDAELARKTAEEWSQMFHADIKAEQIQCDGCNTRGKKFSHCHNCEIRACAVKHKVKNCAYCPDYGCKTITGFFQMAPSAKETLDRIREKL